MEIRRRTAQRVYRRGNTWSFEIEEGEH